MSLFLTCIFIVDAIIMNFLEDRDVGIFYLSTKFLLDLLINNGDLWSETRTRTRFDSDTLSIQDIGLSS